MKKITRFGAEAETPVAARPISGNIEVPNAALNPDAMVCKDLLRLIIMAERIPVYDSRAIGAFGAKMMTPDGKESGPWTSPVIKRNHRRKEPWRLLLQIRTPTAA
jgi:hypothetical protein